MALFTDGEISGLQDLRRFESGLLDVCNVEQIDLTEKMALAQDEIAAELLVFLLKQSPRDPRNIIFTYQSASARRSMGVTDVVITEPLKRWHGLKSIELAYQDAYNNQLNDRYQGKWQQYHQRAQQAARSLYLIGVGLAWLPVPKAASPLLLSITGPNLGAEYYARMTWLNQSGQEGAPSDLLGLQTGDGSQLVISPSAAPVSATGWNAYVGLTPEGVSLQNLTPLAPQNDWLMLGTGLIQGARLGNGQIPDQYVVDDRLSQRG